MAFSKHKTLAALMSITAMTFSTIAFIPAAVADPITITVNSVGDLGDTSPGNGVCNTGGTVGADPECTLRAAIQEANANTGADTIEFEIPGGGLQTFTPATPYDYISDQVTINGYTQPGASANTAVSPNPIDAVIMLELDGVTASSEMAGGFAFVPGSEGSSLRGFSVYNFSHVAVDNVNIDGSNIGILTSDITIAGNFIGLRADGMTVGTHSNDQGIGYNPAFGDISGGAIGGSSPADRNIIYSFSGSNIGAGIAGTSPEAVVYGNYFGIGRDGVTDLSPGELDVEGLQGPYTMAMNLTGYNEASGQMQIGGPSTGQGNVISGNTVGVILSSANNVVQGNFIGTDYTGQVNSGISNGMGMTVTAGTHSLIGGTGAGEGNVIAGVTGAGISIASFHINDRGDGLSMDVIPESIAMLGNSIYDVSVFNFTDFGDMNQAIDLNNFIDESTPGDFRPDSITLQGPTPNDTGDGDIGANGQINTPVLTSAQQVGQNLNIAFDLDVAGSVDDLYRVEFFANDRSTIFGYGPGQTYLGFTNVSSGTGKTATINLGAVDVINKSLSATVTVVDETETSSQGYGSTSEFAQNISIGSATDYDSDGVSDAVENAAPNGGDGNDDGTLDSVQPTVSSYEIANSDTYTTFVTENCSENGSVSSVTESNLVAADAGFAYPYGLTDFSLNCSVGTTVDVTKIVFTPDSAVDTAVRKYRADGSEHFLEVPGSTITEETIAGEPALVLEYSLTDGGSLDDDGIANGIIVDPVGIARIFTSSAQEENTGSASGSTSASGSLAATGTKNSDLQLQASLFLMIAGLVMLTGVKTSDKIRLLRIR